MIRHGGVFVISWSQVRLNGAAAPPAERMRAGNQFTWSGEALRVDGPAHILPLGPAIGQAELRRRAAASVRGLLSRAEVVDDEAEEAAAPLPEQSFHLTDGRQSWTGTLIGTGGGRKPLLMFVGMVPPKERELWVVASTIEPGPRPGERPGGVVCFTPGTLIATEDGPRPVESLSEGARVQTKDNGPQPVLWIGRRRLTGARIVAMPWLAPVRLRQHALDQGVPDAGLLVSPDHRILLRGARALDLFGEREVLVAAADLVDDRLVTRERLVQAVDYIHLLLPAHEIVFANGVETESFHPGAAELESAGEDGLARLLAGLPRADHYGGYARRVLSASEAAILTCAA